MNAHIQITISNNLPKLLEANIKELKVGMNGYEEADQMDTAAWTVVM